MPNNRYHIKVTIEDQTIYVQEIRGSFFLCSYIAPYF